MCNANNHPIGCNCGWGGVWYGSSRDEATWLFEKTLPERSLGTQRTSRTVVSIDGKPNSKCPVCGDSVFFYESPYGGRVFFDDLGPPWPKHPCTDNRPYREFTAGDSWIRSGWRFLREVSIDASDNRQYVLAGKDNSRRYQFRFLSSELALAELVSIRPITSGVFELSMVEFIKESNEWIEWRGHAYTSIKENSLPLSKITLNSLPTSIRDVVKNSSNSPKVKQQKKIVFSTSLFQSPDGQFFIRCYDCATDILYANFVLHTRRIHGYVPIGNPTKIIGRLLLSGGSSKK